MTIFQFNGSGGSAGFVEAMAFQNLTQVGAPTEFAMPSGHIPTLVARNAATNRFDTVVARIPCSLIALSIVVQTASGQGAVDINTRLNGAAAVVQMTLPNAALNVQVRLAAPIVLALGDNLEFTLTAPANCALALGVVSAWFA